MLYGEKMDEFQKSLVAANYEQLLLSSQVMLCELVRRHLEARQNHAESPGTDKQHTQLTIAAHNVLDAFDSSNNASLAIAIQFLRSTLQQQADA